MSENPQTAQTNDADARTHRAAQNTSAAVADSAARESRRAADSVIERLVLDVHDLKRDMVENTKTTKEVRDILTSFKVVGQFARWLGLIVAALVSAWVAIKGLRP